MEKAPAIAYLRTDLSGAWQHWDECRMRRLATRLGYELRAILVLSAASDSRIDRVLEWIEIERAEAVFVPHLDHLDGEYLRVVDRADVIVDAREVYARWPSITSSNSTAGRLPHEGADHRLRVRGSNSRDVRSRVCEPSRSPKARRAEAFPHLRVLPPPDASPPHRPGGGEAGHWLFDQ